MLPNPPTIPFRHSGVTRRAGVSTGLRGVSTIARVLTAFLFIVCKPEAIGRLGRALADTDGVAEVYTTTGSADFIAVVRVPDLDALATVVTQHIAEMPGIVRTDTHMAIRSYGRSDETAGFDIGVD
jgi:DNA-binding Lrp family transcriptional regulator